MRSEQGDAQAFRLMQAQAMVVGQRRIELSMRVAELEVRDEKELARSVPKPRIRDDIHDALSHGDKDHASELLMVLRHFLATHPEAKAKLNS